MGIKELVLRLFSRPEREPELSLYDLEKIAFIGDVVKKTLMDGNTNPAVITLKRTYANRYCPLHRCQDWNKWVDEEINQFKQERGIK